MSVRTFTRRFRKATGTTPGRWLLEQRVRASLPLLEGTDASIETVAGTVGFASAATYRHHFAAIMRTSPTGYRRALLRGQRVGREPRAAAVQAAHHGADGDLQVRGGLAVAEPGDVDGGDDLALAPAGSARIASMTSRVCRISTGSPAAGATRRVSSGSSGARTGRRSRVRSDETCVLRSAWCR